MRIVSILLGGAVATAGAALPASADAAPANLFTNPGIDGSTCDSTPTRQSAPVEFANAPLSAVACTFDQAYDAASCSDRVEMQGGTYAAQTVTGDKTCSGWVVEEPYGVTCTGCVAFEEAAGAGVAVSGGIRTQADWTSFQGLAADGAWAVEGSDIHHVLMKDLTLTGASGKLLRFTTTGTAASHIAWVGGEMNGAQTNGNEPVYLLHMTGVTIDGVHFHNLTRNPSGDHMEVIRLDSGVSDVRIRFNRFEDNQDNTSTIFWTDAQALPAPTGIQIRGNFIESAAPFAIKPQDPTIAVCKDILIDGNTIVGAPALNLTTCAPDNVVVRGNLGTKNWQGCSSANTWDSNVWQHNANVACGSDKWVNGSAYSTSALGLGGAFAPQSGSPALDAGPLAADCLKRDLFGAARPASGAARCDAGAVEVGS
jgi:hypothetical protein